eukprot:5883292-Pyramimonas_sp.AAC.1
MATGVSRVLCRARACSAALLCSAVLLCIMRVLACSPCSCVFCRAPGYSAVLPYVLPCSRAVGRASA